MSESFEHGVILVHSLKNTTKLFFKKYIFISITLQINLINWILVTVSTSGWTFSPHSTFWRCSKFSRIVTNQGHSPEPWGKSTSSGLVFLPNFQKQQVAWNGWVFYYFSSICFPVCSPLVNCSCPQTSGNLSCLSQPNVCLLIQALWRELNNLIPTKADITYF